MVGAVVHVVVAALGHVSQEGSRSSVWLEFKVGVEKCDKICFMLQTYAHLDDFLNRKR